MAKDKPYNAANAKQVEDSLTDQELERRQELRDLKDILATKAGVRFFQRLFERGHIFSSTFTGNSTTFYNEGMRNFALKYVSDIAEVDPDKLRYLMVPNKKIKKEKEKG